LRNAPVEKIRSACTAMSTSHPLRPAIRH
jgi:hypothetical protein